MVVSNTSLTLRLHAVPENASLLRERVGIWLEGLGTEEGDVSDVSLACSEAFANAVQHPVASIAGMVEIHGSLHEYTVSITVRDYGSWRAQRAGEDHGRGFQMMRRLMDTVEVDPAANGTTVTLRRRIIGNGRLL
jgi:anti-sigma regulatory factor (Ser/Thr protein kinase)